MWLHFVIFRSKKIWRFPNWCLGKKRFDVFPIDVWVRRVMNDLYIHNEDEKKVNKKEIKKLADEKFGALEGIAQQYLFYWKREA